MMKILSPAGDFDSLIFALNEGADEIYFGVNEFNARNNVVGFNLEDVGEVVKYCALFNARCFMAVNILFRDEELESAVNLIVKAYNQGVDAFIIQDLGLAKILFENYPMIELHASTQMGIHNLEGVLFLQNFNFKRVVLARETTLKEVKRIKENSNIEIEYFVQGALCVSFSGNCYLSSVLHNASGNRGLCKQLCRLNYTAYEKDKKLKEGYLLSAKDFCMIDRLSELEKAGVDSLKIEGRARRPFYVKTATREYYNALRRKPYDLSNLKLAFNRNYCHGYFDGNGDIISEVQNHVGVCVGKVERVNVGKRFNEVIFSSNREITKKSVLKFYDGEKEFKVITAYDVKKVNGNLFKVTTTAFIKKGLTVRLIADGEKEDEKPIIKRRNLEITVNATVNKPLKAIVSLFDNFVVFSDFLLEEGKNSFLTEEELKDNFNKSEFFEAKLKIENLDKVFVRKSNLNAFRKKVFDCALAHLLKKPARLEEISLKTERRKEFDFDVQIIENKDEELKAKNIIYSPEVYKEEDILNVKNRVEKALSTFYLDTPNYAEKEDIIFLKNLIEKNRLNFVVNNYYALSIKGNKIIGAHMNVFNSVSASYFNAPILTIDGSIGKRVPYYLMTFKHCPIKHMYKCSCDNCKYNDDVYYKNDNGKVLKLYRKKLKTCTFYLK